MGLLKQYTTTLETCESGEISNILNRKNEKVGANRCADYIGTALDNINSSKDRIKDAIAELTAIKKQLEMQEEVIKIGVAKWLLDENGVNSINGDLISSITVYDKAPKQEVIITDEKLIDVSFMKLVPNTTAIKEAINKGESVNGAELITTHNEQSVKVNKKRTKAVKTDELGF